jgi:hypothetical protein
MSDLKQTAHLKFDQIMLMFAVKNVNKKRSGFIYL